MAEANRLDEPLSESEYDDLEAFFGSNAVPQDCMDLEMLDGFLTAIVSGPELIQPSEWLPVVWSDSQRSVSPVFADNEQAERVLSLLLRLQNSIARTLNDSPTRFKPLLYRPEEGIKGREAQSEGGRREETAPPEASAWCEGYMTGVLLREEAWEPVYAAESTRDWMLPVEALAYGDHDPEYLDWVDSEEKRQGLIDELPVAAVLIHRFWLARRSGEGVSRAERRAQRREASRKVRQRLH
jgi:uncharacterized protein